MLMNAEWLMMNDDHEWLTINADMMNDDGEWWMIDGKDDVE